MDITDKQGMRRLENSHSSTFVMRHIPYIVLAGLLLLVLLYQPFHDFLRQDLMVNLWALMVLSILLVSLAQYWICQRQGFGDESLNYFLLRMLHINAIAFACAWSAMLLYIYLMSVREYQLLIILLVCGISAGAFPMLVIFNYVYLLFISIMLLPFVVVQTLYADTSLVATLLLVLWATLGLAASRMGESIRALFYLKEANTDLVHRLADANVDLEELNQQLQEENAYKVKSLQMMREKSQFLERVMDATRDAIMVFDDRGMLVRINREVCELSGYQQEELLGRHYTDNFFPDSDPGLMGMVHDALSAGQEHNRQSSWLLTRGGEMKELSVSVAKLMEQESVYGVVCTMVDCTREKEVERMKNEFFSNVSHELRTPLTSIHGSLRLMESSLKPGLSADMQKMLTIAINNSQRLLSLINDLLDLGQLEAGALQYHYERCSAAELLREAIEATQGYAMNHQVELQLRSVLEQDIEVDRKRFIQVLFNIISNAIKFTPSGKTVFMDMSPHDDYLRIAVTDQGEGIAEAFQPYLFERYRQAATEKKNSGSGLGLHIARQMIETMGGRIAYKTDMGQGSTFFIDIRPLHSGP